MSGYVLILAVCGMVLSLGLALAAVITVLRLRIGPKLKKPRAAAADLLDYAALCDEQVILLKSGALMAVYRLNPPDLSFAEDAVRQQVQNVTAKALAALGHGWSLHLDAWRSEDASYAPSCDQNAPEAVIYFDKARAAYFAAEKSAVCEFYLTLTYAGTGSAERGLTDLVTGNGAQKPSDSSRILIDNFKQQCRRLIDPLQDILRPQLLGQEAGLGFVRHAALSYIHRCFTGKNLLIAYPRTPCYLDSLLSSCDLSTGFTPYVGDQAVACVAVEGLPPASVFGMLNSLALLPFPCRFNTRYVSLGELNSQIMIERCRRFWQQRSRGFLAQVFNLASARVNQHALEMMQQTETALHELNAGRESFGCYSAVLVIMDSDRERLEQKTRQAIAAVERLGFAARLETVNALEAFLGSLPGHIYENLRRPALSNQALADLMPLSAPWQGERYAPCPFYGENASPLMQVRTPGLGRMWLNLHDKDLGNTLVIGPPGSGKSVFLGALILNFLRYKGTRVFAFDKGWSFYALCRAVGGSSVILGSRACALCPLYSLDEPGDLEYALDYIELLCHLGGCEVDAASREELHACLHLMRQRPADERSLSDLHLLLSTPALKAALSGYTVLSDPQALLDSTHDHCLEGSLCVFECASLFERPPRYALPVLRHIFRLIEKSFDGSPRVIIVDEAWLMLEHEYFAHEIIKWFKTLRKHNALVVLATQSLSDAAGSRLFSHVLDCVKTRVLLPNYDALSPALAQAYAALGLNAQEIRALTKLKPKHDLFFKQSRYSAVFSLVLPREELRILSIAGDQAVSRVERAVSKFGSEFYRKEFA